MKNFNRLKEIKDKHEPELRKKQNVVGAGLGKKNKHGEECVVVFVREKKDLSILSESDVIPSSLEEAITDVIEVGDIQALDIASHKERRRPLIGGISMIREGQTSCTLGAIVYKDGRPYALQNAHCAYPHWSGAEFGDNILQPSPNDGGTVENDTVGFVVDGEELDFEGTNTIDAALVELLTTSTEYTLHSLGELDPNPTTVSPGDTVSKSGRTTGVTQSTVSAIDASVNVNYNSPGGGTAFFTGQIFINEENDSFSAGGDSSSLIVNENLQPVGLLYAGSSNNTVACPIGDVIDRFGFTFEKPKGQYSEKIIVIPDGSVEKMDVEGKPTIALNKTFRWEGGAGTATIDYDAGTPVEYLYDDDGNIIDGDGTWMRVKMV